MFSVRSRLLGRRRVAWLLWLALLMPAAQAAATWHELSHVRAGLAGDAHDKALHASACELCVVAAAVVGGAPPGDATPAGFEVARHAAPLPKPVGSVFAAPQRAYLSRAPPFASR